MAGAVGARKGKGGVVAAIVTLAVALLASCAAAAVIWLQQSEDPWGLKLRQHNGMVYDRVWGLVAQNYFDKEFGGIDWDEAKERHRPGALTARNTRELYDRAIWPLLDELKVSHVAADAPDELNGLGAGIHFSGRRGDSLADMGGGVGDLGGITVVHDGKQWTVYDVEQDSTPEKLGVAPGRIVLSARTSPVKNAAVDRMKVDLVLAKGEAGRETISYEFTAEETHFEEWSEFLASGAMVIRFDAFDSYTATWALDEIRDARDEGIILDMRANRGGNIGAMVLIASALLPDGAPIGQTAGRMLTLPVKASADGAAYAGPIAVLIGPQTASAGEMLAYALRQNGRAVMVGDRTSGQVLTARFWPLPDGGRLSVATGNFTASDGSRLEGVGVSPDIPAAETLAAIREGRDLVVETADKALAERLAAQAATLDASVSAP